MNKLFVIEAEINLKKEGGRTWPIKTGYRPGFNFIRKSQTSGSIDLLNKGSLSPGESAIVEVSFISNMLLGDVKSGIEFKFYEGPIEIGNGKVLNVIGWR